MSTGAPADRLGRYILHELLGQGPAGVVHRATDTETGSEIALKLVTFNPDNETDSLLRDLRATNELNMATSLRHPGIVRVHRVDALAEQCATEMEYVRGMSLKDLLGITGRLLPERAVAIALQILDALAYAHARSALHRDLKPTNILIRHDGLAKISDFGFRNNSVAPVSVNAAPIHSYAAPEELEPLPQSDRRSDIWSVGTILFRMLTGRLPFPITDPHDLRAWQRGLKSNEPTPLSKFVPDLPLSLQGALDRALKTSPNERYVNAREFLNALLATGLCAGMTERDEELQERQDATCKRIDNHLRRRIEVEEETRLPDLVRAYSANNPDFEETAELLRYAGLLEGATEHPTGPEPHALGLTPEEMDHLEEIETRLKSLDELERSAPRVPELPPAGTSTMRRQYCNESSQEASAGTRLVANASVEAKIEDLQPRSSRTETRISKTDGAELIFIPAGDFVMGSNGYSEDNAPRRVVTLGGYWIYRYLVTVAQYRRYCEETAYPMPRGYWPWNEMDPIVGVTWHEANGYCAWAGTRLPTEAQWEKAARGVDGRAFPWGDQFDQRSDHRIISKNAGKTLPIGSYPAGSSPFGLMDVVGNVQQWCLDLYDESFYKTATADNPMGPATGSTARIAKSGLVQKLFNKNAPQTSHAGEHRVVRGSSWKDHHESFAYCFRRDAFPPDLRFPWVGFRCAALSSEDSA